MLATSLCLIVSFSAVSGASEETFVYSKGPQFHPLDEVCRVCYSIIDCLELNEIRCHYYVETAELTKETAVVGNGEVDPDFKEEVDGMLYDLVDKASKNPEYDKCIPFISRYTDCNKDNICTGCTTCDCDEKGNWNCTTKQQCQAIDKTLDIDHRVLTMTIENLKSSSKPHNRSKRSESDTPVPKKLKKDDVMEWLYEVPVIKRHETKYKHEAHIENEMNKDRKPNVLTQAATSEDKLSTIRTITAEVTDTDYLAFEEVLKNINVDINISNKTHIDHNDTIVFSDYFQFDGDNDTFGNNVTKHFIKLLKTIEHGNNVTEINTESSTQIIIDLLDYSKNDAHYIDTADFMDSENKLNNDNVFQESNEIEYTAKHIMKRDVSDVTNKTIKTSTEINNITDNFQELRDNVLYPLHSIINDKQKEIDELLKVKEKLLNFMKSYKNDKFIKNTLKDDPVPNNNTLFSIFNLLIEPQNEDDFRRSDVSSIDKYMEKLKRDIYNVVKDVAQLQLLIGPKSLSHNLKVLINALKYYIHSQRDHDHFIKPTSRRNLPHSDYGISPNILRNEIAEVLEVIDKGLPYSNALGPLSTKAKIIIQKIIKQNYKDDLCNTTMKKRYIEYNFTKDLQSIGLKWQQATNDLVNSSVKDKLYNLKFLHLILSSDINKMKNILCVMKFANSRRMILIDNEIGSKISLRINKNFQAISRKMQHILQMQNKKYRILRNNNALNIEKTKQNKKGYLIRKIQKLLQESKKDVLRLIHKKVPKTDIIKELAKKKLKNKEIMEYEKTMQEWQNNLNVTRIKRETESKKYLKRIKNILPKYLRGKVNPALNSKNSKDTKNKTKHSNRIKGHKRRNHLTTTPSRT